MTTLIQNLRKEIAELERSRPDSFALECYKKQLRGYEAAEKLGGHDVKTLYLAGRPLEGRKPK